MSAYLFQAPTGIPGDITRVDESSVEPTKLVAVASVFAQSYGIPMVAVLGGFSQYATTNVAADFAGVLVREVPSIAGSTAQTLTSDVPNATEVQGLCVRGYMSVACTIGTPVRGGIVYIRVIAAVGKAIGDFEATADGLNNVALLQTQAQWAIDGKDATGNTEIRIAR